MQENLFPLLAGLTTLAISLIVAFNLTKLLAKIFSTIVHTFTRLFSTSLEVHAKYRRRSNVVSWLTKIIAHKCSSKLRHFRVTQEYGHFSNLEPLEPLQTKETIFFFYKRTLVCVTRRFCTEYSFDDPVEIYKITAYGTRNKKLLLDMLDEGRKMVDKKRPATVCYHRIENGHTWRFVKESQPRSLSSIILKDGVVDAIQKDVKEFIESKEWYKERGIPYRRGYLLYGPPGCGKTSLVKAISGKFGFDIYELQLSNRVVNDETLTSVMPLIVGKSILLLEDVDCVFLSRYIDETNSEENDGLRGKLKIRESRGSVTFSGLLNAIDGISSTDDYILFMTTNQIGKLDSALIRPGRIDVRQLIDLPDEKQIAAFFKSFYTDCKEDVANSFVKAVSKLNCNPSIAQIQSIFLKHKHKPEDTLQDVHMLLDVCKGNDGLKSPNIYL